VRRKQQLGKQLASSFTFRTWIIDIQKRLTVDTNQASIVTGNYRMNDWQRKELVPATSKRIAFYMPVTVQSIHQPSSTVAPPPYQPENCSTVKENKAKR